MTALGWKVRTVGQLCRKVTSGGTPSRGISAFYEGGTIPWIKTGELRDGYLDSSEEQITPDAVANSSAKLLPPGTVLMAMYGATVGALGILAAEATCNQASCAMIADPESCDPRWLFYTLLNDRTRIVSLATGAAQQNLSGRSIREFAYATPPVGEQRAIAEVLGALDDKIAANSLLAAKTDELAHSQFDRLVGDCKVGRLSDVATLVLGGTPSRARPDFWSGGSVPWLNSGKANESRVIEPTEWITDAALAGSAAKMMPVGATILAITGATLGQVARLEIEACGNQSLVGIWGDTPSLSAWLYFAIRREIPQLLRHATGAAQQHVNKQAVASLLIPFDEATAADFGSLAHPLLERAAQADRESLVLAGTRDALLPGLMSGKIRVKDAERVVEGVV